MCLKNFFRNIILLCSWILFFKQPSTLAEDFSGMKDISLLLQEIVFTMFDKCDTIIFNDEFFKHYLSSWLSEFKNPIYTFSLDGEASDYNYTYSHRLIKRGGKSSCITAIVCCYSVKTCQTPHTPLLFKILNEQYLLKHKRRSFLYIHNEMTETLKPPSLYEDENAVNYSLRVMNDAVRILKGIGSHITLIRELRMGQERTAFGSSKFQLLTWTPNWLPGGSPVLNNVWTKEKGFQKSYRGLIKISRKHIRSGGTARFAVASKDLLPMIQVNSKNQIRGLDAEIMKIFADDLNVSLSYFEPPDLNFGVKTVDGNWTGVIGCVIRKEADFGIGNIMFTYERKNAGVEFSPAFVVFQGVVVCTWPGSLPKWSALLAPLQPIMRYGLLVILIFMLCFFETLQRLARILFKRRKRWGEGWFRKPQKDKIIWLNWIYSIGPLLQKAIPANLIPPRIHFRFIFGIWMFVGFLLSASYSTFLMSSLSFPPKEKPINSLNDLVKGDKRWAISGLVHQALQNVTGKLEQEVLKNALDLRTNTVNPAIDTKIYDFVVNTGSCGVVEKSRAQYIIAQNYSQKVYNQEHPKLRLSRDSFYLGPSGWAFREDMDIVLRNYFERLFMNFRDHGLHQRTAKMFSLPISHLHDSHETEEGVKITKPLGLEHAAVIFYFLLGGMLTSVCVFIFELFYSKWNVQVEKLKDKMK